MTASSGEPFDVEGWLDRGRRVVDDELSRRCEELTRRCPAPLGDAIAYSLLAGGKRLRPILCLAACDVVGGPTERAMAAAAAIEMIHTYSLVHDDLPCMDDDDLRRGKPTSHKVFGEATAVLVGDALLTEAFAALAEASHGVEPDVQIGVVRDVAEAAGALGMVGGQVLDIQNEGRPPEAETLERMHRLKTGALIRVAVRSGARLGGGDDAAVAALSGYGAALGLAFQVIDDILDVVGDEVALGKRAAADAELGKVTFPRLLGLEGARAQAARLTAEASTCLDGLGPRAESLRALAAWALERDR